jgi:hypothetical protein
VNNRPVYVLRVRPEPGVPDVIRSLRSWLKNGLRAHGLRCVSIEEIDVKKARIGFPTAESVDAVWQRQGTAAAILAMRGVIRGDAIRSATPISQLNDVELGWLFAASLFAWIKCRAEQATAEGRDTEAALRLTALDPEPWDAGAVEHILPELGALPDIDWSVSIGAWPKDTMVRFLLVAMKLINNAMIAREIGGSVTTRHKSLDEMQRVAAGEAGGPLVTPDELNDPVPF